MLALSLSTQATVLDTRPNPFSIVATSLGLALSPPGPTRITIFALSL